MKHVVVILLGIGLVLVFSFVLSPSSLFNSTSNRSNKNEKKKVKRIKRDGSKIDLVQLGMKEVKSPILAIGVISANTCAGCVNELIEFSEAIDKVENKFFKTDLVKKYYVVIGQDSSKATWFKHAHDIKAGIIFLSKNSKPANTLSKWNKNREANQWLFINKSSSIIDSRILVLNSVTPIFFKENLVNEVLFSLDNNLTNPKNKGENYAN